MSQEKGDWRWETIEGRQQKGDKKRRQEKGDRRRETGDGKQETEDRRLKKGDGSLMSYPENVDFSFRSSQHIFVT